MKNKVLLNYNSEIFGKCHLIISKEPYNKLIKIKKCILSYSYIDNIILDLDMKPIKYKFNISNPLDILFKIQEIEYTNYIFNDSSWIYDNNDAYNYFDQKIKIIYKDKQLKFKSFEKFYKYFGIDKFYFNKKYFQLYNGILLEQIKDNCYDSKLKNIKLLINAYCIENGEYFDNSKKESKFNSKTEKYNNLSFKNNYDIPLNVNHDIDSMNQIFMYLYWNNVYKYVYGDRHDIMMTYKLIPKVIKVNSKDVKISLKKFLHKLFIF